MRTYDKLTLVRGVKLQDVTASSFVSPFFLEKEKVIP